MGKFASVSRDKGGKSVEVTFKFNRDVVLNVIFGSALVGAVLLMIFFTVSNLSRAVSDAFADIDLDLLAHYTDEDLNCTFYIPGTTWEMAEMDRTELQETVKSSMGDDEEFSLRLDPLKEEVLALLCFNEVGDSEGGYRQFLTFSFRGMPAEVNPGQFGAYNGGSTEDYQVWLDYCKASFENDMMVTGNTAEILDMQMLSGNYGVLMHTVVNEVVTSEDGSSTTEPLYYTQFIYPIGSTNIGIATFGSIYEDTSIDNYLAYMLSHGTYY